MPQHRIYGLFGREFMTDSADLVPNRWPFQPRNEDTWQLMNYHNSRKFYHSMKADMAPDQWTFSAANQRQTWHQIDGLSAGKRRHLGVDELPYFPLNEG